MKGGKAVGCAGWSLAIALLLSTWSAAQAPSRIEYVEGPVYTATEIRRISILGIHLGMAPDEAAQVMEKHHFHFLNSSKTETGGYYESADRGIWMHLYFAETGSKRVLEAFTYYRHDYTDAEMADVPARRAELLALLGQPTRWEKWTRENGIGDRFSYVPDRAVIENLRDAWMCYVNWECETQRDKVDCRPLVRQINFPVVTGGFGWHVLSVDVKDYTRKSAALLSDGRFLRQDSAGAICPVPKRF